MQWLGYKKLSGSHCSALCLNVGTERGMQESLYGIIQIAGGSKSPEVTFRTQEFSYLFSFLKSYLLSFNVVVGLYYF